jgi:hypothetical protein
MRIRAPLVWLGALALSGCDEKAVEFAQKSRLLLAEYQSRLETQIRETEEYYRRYSSLQVDSDRERRLVNLSSSRKELTDRLSVDYVEKKKTPSRVREDLRVYAEQAQKENSAWLMADADRTRTYLERLETLRIERDRIEAFHKLMGLLSAKRTFEAEAEDIAKFAQSAKMEFDQLICADLHTKRNAEQDAAKKKALQQLFVDRKCR